ncbi:hypothetical protein DICA1_F29184 [Diutina catenulata]
MSSQHKKAFEDLLPGYTDPIPRTLIAFVDSVYSKSLAQLPNFKNGEVGRYHICAYLGLERFRDRLNLPDPDRRMIPVPPKVANKLIEDLRMVVDRTSSPSSTPTNSPTKRQQTDSPFFTPKSSFTSPTKPSMSPAKHSPKKSSPLKRLREAAQEGEPTPKRLTALKDANYSAESPFNPSPATKSPTLEPSDDESADDSTPMSSPSKQKAKKKYVYDRKRVSVLEFVQFANAFKIPAEVTTQLLNSFAKHRDKFVKKSEWLLACGLVYAAYSRINFQLLKQLGKDREVRDLLMQCQRGGLNKKQLEAFLKVVEDYIKAESWAVALERHYMNGQAKESRNRDRAEYVARTAGSSEAKHRNELLQSMGSMITGADLYESDAQSRYLATWTANTTRN